VRIVYVAQHDRPNSNDDEGAIAHALAEAGHTVVRVPETDAGRRAPSTPGDVLLFHKWSGPDTLARVAGRMLRVMWYFDLVKSGAPGLARLSKSRADWMASVLPHLDVGFCTDGDWVEEYNGRCFGGTRGGHRDKLYWLPQGADGRVAGRPGRGRESRYCTQGPPPSGRNAKNSWRGWGTATAPTSCGRGTRTGGRWPT
jgi:hypothetical protein